MQKKSILAEVYIRGNKIWSISSINFCEAGKFVISSERTIQNLWQIDTKLLKFSNFELSYTEY